jgi:hypothetical protein
VIGIPIYISWRRAGVRRHAMCVPMQSPSRARPRRTRPGAQLRGAAADATSRAESRGARGEYPST